MNGCFKPFWILFFQSLQSDNTCFQNLFQVDHLMVALWCAALCLITSEHQFSWHLPHWAANDLFGHFGVNCYRIDWPLLFSLISHTQPFSIDSNFWPWDRRKKRRWNNSLNFQSLTWPERPQFSLQPCLKDSKIYYRICSWSFGVYYSFLSDMYGVQLVKVFQVFQARSHCSIGMQFS